MNLRYGVILPGGTAPEQLELAILAERSGWDGVFVWETGYGVDAWSLLAAMAVATERVRLGTILTPLPWRRPWKVASQVATVDQLSGGRAILGIGVGALDDALPKTGEESDLRTRAAMMDEGIDLMRTLWSGGTSFQGVHYRCEAPAGDLKPVQERIPIWVVGVWPRPKSMRRVLRCDGIIPGYSGGPDAVREVRAWLTDKGASPDFDILAEGETSPADSSEVVAPWAAAGCTWWMETRWGKTSEIRERITAGP